MPPPVTRRPDLLALLGLALACAVLTLTVGSLPPVADAQTVPPGIQVTSTPGATVDYSAAAKTEPRTLVTSCDGVAPDAFAVAGGWSIQGTATFEVTDNFASRLPAPGFGAGAWTLTVSKLTRGTLTVTPSVTCLTGATQVPQ
jgi:hypothetical protein